MKELFDQMKSITDALNAGRLIFYPFAGALIVYPLAMLARLLAHDSSSLSQPLFTQMSQDLTASGVGLVILSATAWRGLMTWLSGSMICLFSSRTFNA